MVIDAEGVFDGTGPKLALGALRYRSDDVVAVIDSAHSGRTARDRTGDPRVPAIPVVDDLDAALRYGPDTFVVGISPMQSTLPPGLRDRILAALEAKLDVVCGLHHQLGDDPELSAAADRAGRQIWDLRRPPQQDVRVGTAGSTHRPGSHTVLAVGSDCNAGKMTTMVELDREAARRGLSSRFVATGQTGILVAGDGVPADHVVADFLPTLMHQHVCAATAEHDLVFVEGQAALNHPWYSGVSLGLLHGTAPDALVLCHIAGARDLGHLPLPIPPLPQVVAMNEAAATWGGGPAARVVAIALNTGHLSESEAADAIAAATGETGLPAVDVFRSGPAPLLDAILAAR
ncbi:DUF1611 domain-containing protein [Actinocatenispora sera]|jgi:uncharacterized NAD-dependent epimerase/dehydratase family protein|uniref:DUF1611 domain-containing protein n=1 Tax=Actinocatenispora sera TaxID=390989 RepID=A0A810KZ97_9ACTN|nr:DUF1611 domain-containing protein [Actinocatenispora sera]BCJ27752.1 hypothetical protein Asera_18600 [Actinocatenispora sera]